MDWTIIILIVYLIPLCICLCMALHCLWKHVCKNSTVYRAYFGKLQFVYRCRSEKLQFKSGLKVPRQRCSTCSDRTVTLIEERMLERISAVKPADPRN